MKNYSLLLFSLSGIETRSSSDARRRVLDADISMRRQKRQLEAKDNYHDHPHASFAHLLNEVKITLFSDRTESKLYIYSSVTSKPPPVIINYFSVSTARD